MSEQRFTYALSFTDVIRILGLIDGTQFRELELDLGDLKLRVLQDFAGAPPVPKLRHESEADSKHAPDIGEVRVQPLMATRSVLAPVVSDGVVTVVAPLAGTFYRAPSPGASPFVELGSTVREGDVVGILEIMKLMNQVTAPCSGVVREILARNEEFVEFGQPLVVIIPGPAA